MILTILLAAILVALVVQIVDARARDRHARQREEQQRQEREGEKRRELEEGSKPRRRVAVQMFQCGETLFALDAEGRAWNRSDDRWWFLDHLMLPQVEDDAAFNLFVGRHAFKLDEFLKEAKARYEAASAEPFPKNITHPDSDPTRAIREFVASLNEPEKLGEAREREVKRNFYVYLENEKKKVHF